MFQKCEPDVYGRLGFGNDDNERLDHVVPNTLKKGFIADSLCIVDRKWLYDASTWYISKTDLSIALIDSHL